MRARIFGLRGGVTLLVLLALIPSIIVISLSARDRRNDSEERLADQAEQLANAALVTYEHWIDTTETFLLPLANVFALIPDLEELSDEACAPVLDELIARDGRFLYVGGADTGGNILCGSPARDGRDFSLSESPLFQRVLTSGRFALGGLTTDDLGGKPTIRAGYPVLGPFGVRAVAWVALDLAVLSEELGRIGPEGFTIALADDNGAVFARYPLPDGWEGDRLDPTTFDEQNPGEQLFGDTGDDLLFASVTQEEPFAGAIRPVQVVAGLPTGEAFAGVDTRLRNDLLALAGVAVIALAVAWFGSGFLLRDLGRFVGTTRALAAGDRAARVGPAYPRGELGLLGRSFDDMAKALAERQGEVDHLNATLERRVEERTNELERANAELEAFSYSVSHDLRAPLRAIDGFARIILDEHSETLDRDANRYFDSIRSNSKQMGTLIDDLLTFSRLGRRAIARTDVSMQDLAAAVVSELTVDGAGRAAVSIGDLPPARCDASLMRQVFANLVDNSLKFTRTATAAKVTVGFDTAESAYFVRDNGVGFDMQYAGKLFGVFQRLHRAEDFEGTGVGLAIVQRIVNRHGGRTWARSTPGVETTFYFTIGEEDRDGE